ncbi:MAG: nicotinate-nucleotide pyrophosphorylase [Desulfitibacter sp. BRH_c19]|nr:MAG: nicotinate-nucleotide pyrophosphorylase [Desulfitibacter sp. BRH_c19]
MEINLSQLQKLVTQALVEDIGHGDLTTDNLFSHDIQAKGYFLAKDDGIIAGLTVAETVFKTLSPNIAWEEIVKDGDKVQNGMKLVYISGSLPAILTGERVALNFLQRLSGIATKTHSYVKKVKGYPVRIVDTRKTAPGLRILDKYAVRVGGGSNHRFGLYDAVMLKDNHLKAAGSITKAISILKEKLPFTIKIEVETEDLKMVQEALDNKVDIIMLDNMSPEMMVKAVELVKDQAIIEASGGITLDSIKEIAATGVNIISVGDLTHSVKALDISLELS